MIGRELWTMARKELLLLVRDLHGMLLLFIMPLVFIVVMSLAMRDQYAANAGRPQDVLVVDGNAGPASAELLATLRRNPGYRYEVVPAERREAARQRAREGKVAFLMEIRPAPAGSAAARDLCRSAGFPLVFMAGRGITCGTLDRSIRERGMTADGIDSQNQAG